MRTYYAWFDTRKNTVECHSTLDQATNDCVDYATLRAKNITEATRLAMKLYKNELDFHALGGGDLARDECGEI